MALSNCDLAKYIEVRENDLQAAERLTTLVVNLTHIGSSEQRNGRDRSGRFVAQPKAIESQAELEAALLAVAKRIREREEHP